MKLIIPFLLICHSIFAQQIFLKPDTINGKYSFSEIIKVDSALSEKAVYSSVLEWANSPGNKLYHFPSNEMNLLMSPTQIQQVFARFGEKETVMALLPKIKSENKDQLKLTLGGIFKYSDKGFSCMQVCYTKYNLVIQIKKGRTKVTFSDYSMEVFYHSTSSSTDNSNFTLEEWILGKRYDMSELCKKRTSEYTIELQKQNFLVLESLKKHLSSLTAEANEDW